MRYFSCLDCGRLLKVRKGRNLDHCKCGSKNIREYVKLKSFAEMVAAAGYEETPSAITEGF